MGSDLQAGTTEGDRLLVGEVGDVGKDLGALRVLQSVLDGLLALEGQVGSDQVLGPRSVQGSVVLDNFPADQAVLLPNGLDKRHVSLEVVGLIESDVLIIGVHDRSVVRHNCEIEECISNTKKKDQKMNEGQKGRKEGKRKQNNLKQRGATSPLKPRIAAE